MLTETVVDFYIFWQIPSFTIACIIILFSWDWWSTTDCKGTETLPTTWDLMFFLFTFLLDFDDFIEWKNYIGQNKSEFSLIFEVNYALPFRGFIWQFMESTILVRSCKIITFTSIFIFKFSFKYWILTFVVDSRSKEIEADFSEERTASWVQRLHSRQQATLPSWAHGTSSVVVAQWTVTQKTSVKLMFS